MGSQFLRSWFVDSHRRIASANAFNVTRWWNRRELVKIVWKVLTVDVVAQFLQPMVLLRNVVVQVMQFFQKFGGEAFQFQ